VDPRWDSPVLEIASDSGRRRKYRRLASRWRETQLGLPPGVHPTSGKLVGSLLPADAPPDANWLTPQIADYVAERVPQARADGETIEPGRLARNLLSSQPLCFNLFGQLHAFPNAGARVLSAVTGTAVDRVTLVLVEHTPPDAKRLMGDRSAFDAYLEIDTPTGPGFFGVETKYTEPFSRRQYDSPAYAAATNDPASWFRPGTNDTAKKSATNQLWRTLLLAQLTETTKPAAQTRRGTVVVVTTTEDPGATKAVAGIRPLLREPDARLRHVHLEDIVTAARAEPDLRAWADLFHIRYLDV
jgi:hypothetical protein